MMTGLPDDRCVAVSHPGGDLAQTTVAYVARNVEQTDDHALRGRLTALDPPHGGTDRMPAEASVEGGEVGSEVERHRRLRV